MSEGKRVVLMAGSPKGLERSASAKLGRQVTDGLESFGWQCDAFHLHAAVGNVEWMSELLAAIDIADLVLLSTPLYVDSLPAPVIHALYRIATHRAPGAVGRMPSFFSIVNCGFVEPQQNAGAQQMLRLFCRQAHLNPVGEISLGAGGALTKPVRQAFLQVIEALADGDPIPASVADLTGRRIMPAFLYVLGGNFTWKRQAKANGVRAQLEAQPYKRA